MSTNTSLLNGFEFLLEAQSNLEDIRNRFAGIMIQATLNVFLVYLFTSMFLRSIWIVKDHPKQLDGWCCLVASGTGFFILSFIAIPFILPFGLGCHTVISCIGTGLCISSMSINILLLHRAYLAHRRSKIILYSGILLLLPAPSVAVISWTHVGATITEAHGCRANYPDLFPYLRIAVDAPLNLAFSAAFLNVVYRQQRRCGGPNWSRLTRNSTILALTVTTSNLTCLIVNTFNLLGEASDSLFMIDWVLTTVLSIRDTEKQYDIRKSATQNSLSQRHSLKILHTSEICEDTTMDVYPQLYTLDNAARRTSKRISAYIRL